MRRGHDAQLGAGSNFAGFKKVLFLKPHTFSNPNLWPKYSLNVNQGPNPYDPPFSSLFVPHTTTPHHTTIWKNANFDDLLLETDYGFRIPDESILLAAAS
jgi:hypothetical protein